MERLLDAADFDQTPLSVRDRALLEVLYGTGARISEAVGLDVDDVNLAERTVLLRGKGGDHHESREQAPGAVSGDCNRFVHCNIIG